MSNFQRILRTLRRTGMFSVFLVAVMLTTSVMADLPKPVFAATTADTAADTVTANLVTRRPHGRNAPHASASVRATPDEDVDVASDDRKTSLHVPQGALDEDVEIRIVQHGSWATQGNTILDVIELNAFPLHWNEPVTTRKIREFNRDLTLTIKYDPNELRGQDLDTLKLYYLDEESGGWTPLADSRFDPQTSTLTATTNHFSYYGSTVYPTILGPGKTMSSLSGLHSGAAVTEFGIAVPPGSGGFEPTIKLYYDSGTVDEMKNRRSVGSWVGIGWSLGMGSICYDPATSSYLLSFNGATYYRMVDNGNGTYSTNPQSFYRIVRSGEQWDVWDSAGTNYRFGGTADSRQYYDNTTYYRWDLSSMQDTNPGNAITVTYVQDLWTDNTGYTHVRSAYPSHVRYNGGHVDIRFNSISDTNEEGYGPLRRDNPQIPAPKVVENRKLDSIETLVDGNLARRYAFTYETTDDTVTEDYGGISYSGWHTLSTITEIGADNVTALPAVNFGYTPLEVYHFDDDEPSYTGNPGNPASLSWPYLVSTTNGNGATFGYSYTQLPSPAIAHVWTRQALSGETIDPGIGTVETYEYSYTGDPQYLHIGPGSCGWDDQYRGFPQVTVTDAEGNSNQHYFWTTGTEEAEILTGKEYRTEWYAPGPQLLRKTESIWLYESGPSVPFVYLERTTDTTGSKVARIRYEYDDYGNAVTEYRDGDSSITTDDAVVRRTFYPNTTANILGKMARETVYDQAGSVKGITTQYYDGHNDNWTAPPTIGNVTRVDRGVHAALSVTSYLSYDDWGNQLSETDPMENQYGTTYDSTYHTFAATSTSPIVGTESYTYDPLTGNLLSTTDVNGQVTAYEYDALGRNTAVVRPLDLSSRPTIRYEYNNWGTLGQQHLQTLTKVADGDYHWKKEYCDGLGRVVQTQSRGDSGHTMVDSTTAYNNRGLAEREYLPVDLPAASGYTTPQPDWKYTSYQYDGLGRLASTMVADGTVISTDYSIAWQETVTNANGYKHRYTYDGFGQLTKVEELDASHAVYATTTYAYDTLGNLTTITDANGNITSLQYDWLSRKTTMTHPDMGYWTYGYDANGNLITQTDARGQVTTLYYDALNRLTNEQYPAGCGSVAYTFDSTADGNYGKGLLTQMSDASGTTAYRYDVRGRTIQEKHTVFAVDYVTGYSYDSADRLAAVTYPTGEVVTQTYSSRGLPDTLSGTVSGSLVTQTLYNQLGVPGQIDFGNGVTTTYAYYGLDAGAPSGYWGRLWQIRTSKASTVLQDMRCTWDANGNLTQRQDLVAGETEDFTYDFLDRLTSASGPYSETYVYDKIGNITYKNGQAYTYGAKPHAVTSAGENNYAYDANGNMISDGLNSVFDCANRLVENEEPTLAWYQMYYTENEQASGHTLRKTSGGGYIILADVVINGGNNAIRLIKTDAGGNKTWEETYSRPNEIAQSASVQQTSDGGYIVVGTTRVSGQTEKVWLFKTGSNGGMAWEQVFDNGGLGGFANCVQQTSDGYIITGKANVKGTTDPGNVWLIKTNPYGTKSWDAKFGHTDFEFGWSVVQTSDGGYAIGAYDTNNGAWLIKTNNRGRKLWERTYGLATGDAREVMQTSDGGLAVACYGGHLIKTDANGNTQWSRRVSSALHSVRQTTDDAYVASGGVSAPDGMAASIVRADSYGNKVWEWEIGALCGQTVEIASDGGFVTTSGYYGAVTISKVKVTGHGSTYDGNGVRVVDMTDGGATVYVNRYYEKNLGTGEETSHYYLGSREVAYRKGNTLEYIHQDYLGSTSLTTNNSGDQVATVDYLPFGVTRSVTGALNTEHLFTGQKRDNNVLGGLYYLNSRYYDPDIGRFISPDTLVADYMDPQTLNPYSYCRNNPLKYTDPSGHWFETFLDILSTAYDIGELIKDPGNPMNWAALGADLVCVVLPGATGAGLGLRSLARLADSADDAVDLAKAIDKGWDFTKTVDKGLDLTRNIDKGTDLVKTLDRGADITETLKLTDATKGVEALDLGKAVRKGTYSVYQGFDKAGTVRYVGITKRSPGVRFAEHARSLGTGKESLRYRTLEGAQGLSKSQARVWEQRLISNYGMQKNGGQLLNRVNSIDPKYWRRLGV